MNDDEYKAKEIEWFNKTLNKRVERWKQIIPATYNTPLPELVWGYLSMTDEMYISGQFAGAIIFCASIAELILTDKIESENKILPDEMERIGLNQLIKKAHGLGILNDNETMALDTLRELRNSLVHGKAGKLTQMAKRRYTVQGTDDSFLDAEFYISSGFEGGIDQDAKQHLVAVRELSVRFYGVNS